MATPSQPAKHELNGDDMAKLAFRFAVAGTLLFVVAVIALQMLMP